MLQPNPPPQGKTALFHQFQGQGFYLAQFKTPELAIFSYYIESDGQAWLIDPAYDVYPYQDLADKRKAKISSILLTHYHADYIAGHTQFNLPLIMGPKSIREINKIKVIQMADQATTTLGKVTIKIIHTPGHTLESTCYLLIDSAGKQVCLFTGDTIFLNEVGRPDLTVSSSLTSEDLAKMLFQSLNKVKKGVDPSVRIYPTHGSGSACGKSIGEGNFCTLEKQLQNNYALKIENEADFVKRILQEMPKPPSYFFYDAKLNQVGERTHFEDHLKASNKALTIEEFKEFIDKGCIVIDTRNEYEGKSIKDSYLMPEKGMIATWVGSLLKPQDEILLICAKDKGKDQIERLFRIGYFNIKGYNGFTLDEWKQKGLPTWQPKISTTNALVETQDLTILDVRNLGEWKAGVTEGAKLISLGELPTRFEEVRNLPNIHIHCKTGMRARVASSILAQKGIPSTVISGKFQDFSKSGVKIVPYQ